MASISCVDKGHPTIIFPDRTVKYAHPDDVDTYLRADAYAPNGFKTFTYSIVDDPSSTGEAQLVNYNLGVMVNVTKTGTIKIKASSTENQYFLAGEKIMTLTVNKGTRQINFYGQEPVMMDTPYELKATVGVYNPQRPDNFTFEAMPPNSVYTGDVVLSGEGGKIVTPVKAGYVRIRAVLMETDLYLGGEVMRTLEIRKATPGISFSNLTMHIGSSSIDLNATAYQGAHFIYSIEGGKAGAVVLSGQGNKTITPVSGGVVTLKAYLPETQNYFSAQRTATLTITTLEQTISFQALENKSYGHEPFALSATASSELPVVYASNDNSLATVSGNTVTIQGAGSVTITASQPGDETFSPAAPVQRTLTISKKPLTVSAQNVTRLFGTPNPPFVATYQGFVNGDNEHHLDAKPSGAYTPATQASPPGDYSIAFSALGSDNNYIMVQGSGILTIERDILTGIENPTAYTIEVWPNPASSLVVIKSGENAITKISVIDVVGKSTDYDVPYKNEHSIETKAMTKGLYIVSIHLDNGATVFKRLVIQ